MSDQCKYCAVRGNINECRSIPCSQLDNWYAKEQQKKIDELQDFAIWLTGCGYDFEQHDYFCKQRDKLLLNHRHSDSEEIDILDKE